MTSSIGNREANILTFPTPEPAFVSPEITFDGRGRRPVVAKSAERTEIESQATVTLCIGTRS